MLLPFFVKSGVIRRVYKEKLVIMMFISYDCFKMGVKNEQKQGKYRNRIY